mmetsp:Transcript_57946/g.99801  ORF Transcript_57946/g.99801 Transcript_57946/m.99801 type:complete len:207 (+) Transcript_57946:145-765(+)|eukprot:CAMPEP_0171912870 /NCGR_PEP_ID=MMETSP0993-20121228/11406_1 /TAXON_ID=483369 /ORGANISM="non described non described, Strain CCMP2098" /LENGTH=206 /DNA_ID=CAMNT_0012546787 /DNA_START=136 /DNA_END=756 /DNA_ORIENTATION=+
MAGRGRGRGRGRGGNNALMDFYEANREEIGDISSEAPSTWPEIKGGIPALVPLTIADVQLIKTMRRHEKRIRESPFFTTGSTRGPEVQRWSNRLKRSDEETAGILDAALEISRELAPPELFAIGDFSKKKRRGAGMSAKELEALEKNETTATSGGGAPGSEAVGAYEDGDDDGGEASDADQDYVENHYASDDNDVGDDDAGGGDYY